jgi:hypothetical protein
MTRQTFRQARAHGWPGVVACASSLLLLPPSSSAQERQFEGERGSLILGAFVTDHGANARLASDSGPGTDTDLEDDLGLDSTTTIARFGGYFGVKPRQSLDVGLCDLSQDATKRIKDDRIR